jgi:iron complex transport system ATP-binding protein
MPDLEARAVSLRRGGRQVLADIDASVAPGHLTALVGPNGSGKSTLLRVLAGLLKPDAGQVWLDGRLLTTWPRRDIACRLALLPQDTRADFAFQVDELVAMGRHPHRGRFERSKAADHAAVSAALARCALGTLRTRALDTLSGGERQRVAIARCLATQAPVLLLDEPTAHLDLEHALGLFALCRSLAEEGRAVALATHDLALALRHATRVLVLSAGRVHAFGPPHEALRPEVCRAVFGVEAGWAHTATGAATLVFDSPDSGAHRGVRS